MKKFAALAFGAAMSFGAYAAPATSLPPGPVYLKFSGQEQIATGGATTYTGTDVRGAGEINWGVFTISTMEVGKVNVPNNQLSPTGDIFFTNNNNSQITGMFYGVKQGIASANNPFPATSGFLDLYWRDLDSGLTKTSVATVTPGVRCGYDCATGFTDGTLLARLFFDTGIDNVVPTNTIRGDVVPSEAQFTGFATSYASVNVAGGGLWADQLNSDYFRTLSGALRDLRFANRYDANVNWNGGAGVFGAQIDDPGQAFALPEPGALSLMGLAMVGMGAALRRREKKAA